MGYMDEKVIKKQSDLKPQKRFTTRRFKNTEKKILSIENYSSIMSLHFDKEEYENYLKIKFPNKEIKIYNIDFENLAKETETYNINFKNLWKEIKTYNNYEIMLRAKAYNYQYNFDEKINEIRNINYNFNENFYIIEETLFNQKKYINSKLFILMLSSFFAFNYIWIIFLISKLREKNE